MKYTITLISLLFALHCYTQQIFIPNSFTPDDSGPNNTWLPIGNDWVEMHYTIYDKWGEVIFISYNGTNGWDGTYKGVPCQIDTYVYHIEWVDNLKQPHQEYGRINLLR